jgi:FixJ family two-component response regulator
VVVVDDDASVRRGLERLLKSAGYTVETFASVQAFLEGADLLGLTCLVLDVRMPGASGLDLQAALAADGHQVPIVFITGHGDVSMAVRAMKAGAVDFLPKPFDAEKLFDAIAQAQSRPSRSPHIEDVRSVGGPETTAMP